MVKECFAAVEAVIDLHIANDQRAAARVKLNRLLLPLDSAAAADGAFDKGLHNQSAILAEINR